MNAADILDRAADEMEKVGKSVLGYEDESGICAVHAIANARRLLGSTGILDGCPAYRFAKQFVPYGGIACWSDSNDQATVVAGLRSFAAIYRAQQSRLLPVVIVREAEHV